MGAESTRVASLSCGEDFSVPVRTVRSSEGPLFSRAMLSIPACFRHPAGSARHTFFVAEGFGGALSASVMVAVATSCRWFVPTHLCGYGRVPGRPSFTDRRAVCVLTDL